MGNIEVKMIVDKLKPKVIGSHGDEKKIFRDCPHMTWDNYFSGDKIFDYIEKNGFGCTMTCRRDRLPGDIDGKYLHKKKTDIGKNLF